MTGWETVAGVDLVTVERLCSELWPSPSGVSVDEQALAIARMYGWGLSDAEIAARLGGITGAGVQRIRRRAEIGQVAP